MHFKFTIFTNVIFNQKYLEFEEKYYNKYNSSPNIEISTNLDYDDAVEFVKLIYPAVQDIPYIIKLSMCSYSYRTTGEMLESTLLPYLAEIHSEANDESYIPKNITDIENDAFEKLLESADLTCYKYGDMEVIESDLLDLILQDDSFSFDAYLDKEK